MDANTLKKTGENGLSADRAAYALRLLFECPFLLDLVEGWEGIPLEIREAILKGDESTDVPTRIKKLW